MKIERTFSQEDLSNDKFKTTYTKSADFDFGRLAIIILLAIIVYESFRSGFFLTVPTFVWYGLFVVLVVWVALSLIIPFIALIIWRNE